MLLYGLEMFLGVCEMSINSSNIQMTLFTAGKASAVVSTGVSASGGACLSSIRFCPLQPWPTHTTPSALIDDGDRPAACWMMP